MCTPVVLRNWEYRLQLGGHKQSSSSSSSSSSKQKNVVTEASLPETMGKINFIRLFTFYGKLWEAQDKHFLTGAPKRLKRLRKEQLNMRLNNSGGILAV